MARRFGISAKQTSTGFDKPPIGDENQSERQVNGLKGLMRKVTERMAASSAARATGDDAARANASEQAAVEAAAPAAGAFFITRARNSEGSQEGAAEACEEAMALGAMEICEKSTAATEACEGASTLGFVETGEGAAAPGGAEMSEGNAAVGAVELRDKAAFATAGSSAEDSRQEMAAELGNDAGEGFRSASKAKRLDSAFQLLVQAGLKRSIKAGASEPLAASELANGAAADAAGVPSTAEGSSAGKGAAGNTNAAANAAAAAAAKGAGLGDIADLAKGAFGEDGDAPVVNPPLRTRPWQRVLSVTMSILLAATMFDASGLSPLFQDATAAEAESAQPQDAADDQPAEGEGAGETTDGDQAATAPEGEGDAANSDATPAEGPDAAEGEGDEPAAQPEQQPTIDEAAEVAKLLPEHLVSATDVLPAKFEGDADISARINPTLTLFGAPMVSGTGFLVKNGPVQADYTLGNLAALLEDGCLGGSAVNDAVVLTFELPYLYEDAEGNIATTYSEELWKVKRGITADNNAAGAPAMRAALFADAAPAGWSVWQEHDGAYLKLSDADLKAGVSGKIVLRYEGEVPAGLTAQEAKDYTGPTVGSAPNRTPAAITAESTMPVVGFGLVGNVPADEEVAVRFGYEARSFTPAATANNEEPATQYGRAMVKTLGSVNLVNDETDAAANVTVENGESAVINSEGGYLVSKVQIAVPENKPAVSGISLSGLWATDANGFGGVPAAVLMAYKKGEDGGDPVPNLGDDGAPDTSKDARERSTFVGVPGEGGVVVVDVTELSEAQRAALDFSSRDSLREAGLSAIPYKVTEEGLLALTLDDDEGAVAAGKERTFYVAAPYALSAMELEDAPEALPGAKGASPLGAAQAGTSVQKFKPVVNELDVSVLVRTQGKAVALPFHERMSATFTRTADPEAPAAPAAPEGEGNGEGDGEGEADDPDPDSQPAADEPQEEESTYTPPHQRGAGGAHGHLWPWPHRAGQRHEFLVGPAVQHHPLQHSCCRWL